MIRYILSLFLLLVLSSSHAQSSSVLEENWFFTPEQDSMLRAKKISYYDNKQRLIQEESHFFDLKAYPKIRRRINVKFDSTTQILHRQISSYSGADYEEKTTFNKTLYWTYHKDKAQSRPLWTRHYDQYMELTKEDTFLYQSDSLLSEQCAYNYTGNTSLFCQEYTYNKKGLKKQWKTRQRWTTISAGSKVVEKNKIRRKFNYFYTQTGLLKGMKGKYYKTKHRQKRRYDKQGNIQRDYYKKTYYKTVNKKSSKDSKSTKKKHIKTVDLVERRYIEGKPLEERWTINGVEKRSILLDYKDGLKMKYLYKENGKKHTEKIYSYSEDKKLTKKESTRFNRKGKATSKILSLYDQNEHLVKEIQIVNEKVRTTMLYQYNEKGQILCEILMKGNRQIIEKTVYIYKRNEKSE